MTARNQTSAVASERELARAMLAAQRPVDHPIITRCTHSSPGNLSFTEGSPYLLPENYDLFLNAARNDASLMTVEPAKKVFRHVDPAEDYPVPESCTPYTDANGLGFYLKPLLPLVFVRTKKGELLLEARVALKYLRENARRFASVLDTVEHYAQRIFEPEAYAELKSRHPRLFSDVAQPYAAFSNMHIAMGAGCYVKSPPGIATLLGPPINQQSVLSVYSGLMESEWHHSELFVVFDCPDFSDQVLMIEPDTVLAQFSFVAKAAHDASEVVFSEDDLGADPAYRARSIEVGLDMIQRGKPFVISKTTGVKSLSIACPHCWVSVTAAAEGGVPDEHVHIQDFYQGYKTLRAEYRRSLRQQN